MNLLANISIGKRLALGFTIILAFAVLITGISVWRLQGVASATSEMMQVPLAKERMISDWSGKIDSGIRRTTAIARSSDPSLGAYFAEESKASSAASGELQKKIETLISDDDEKELFGRIGEQRKVYLSSRDQINKLKTAGELDEATKIFENVFKPGTAKYQELIVALLKMQRAKIDAAATHIEDIASSSRRLLFVLAALVLVFGATSAWLLTTGIVRPLQEAVAAARRVANGDLTGHIDDGARDETGQLLSALKDMNASLLNIVTEVRTGTDHITTSSTEIAQGNQDLSRRTEQQAGALEETASSMEELTSTVKHNADNARQANQLAASAAQVAVKGGAVVAQVVGTMDSINQSSSKIVDIIAVIDGIAFQTNILALNAAASTAALSARMLVWKAMPSMTAMMSTILLDDWLIESMVPTTCATTAPPLTATCAADAASWLAWRALSALCLTVDVSSSIDDAVSSSAPACCSVRRDRSWLPCAISLDEVVM